MGNIFCKTIEDDQEIIAKDVAAIGVIDYSDKNGSCLKPSGKSYCLHDNGYDVLMLYIEMEGWSPTHFCLRQNKKNALKWNAFRTNTPMLNSENSYEGGQ